MSTILIFLIILTIGYIGAAWCVGKELPKSISDTSYLFNKHFGKYYLFMLYCFIMGFLLLPIWIIHSSDAYTFLPFLSCAGMLFAGATPFFKQEFERKVHYPAAIVSMIGYAGWMCLSGFIAELSIGILISAIFTLLDRERYMLYLEVPSILVLLMTLLISY